MNGKWKIWIDTGGTFTDCIALSPGGKTLRVKVLSTGCLRGRLHRREGPRQFRFSHNWGVEKDIFPGYSFFLLGEKDPAAKILSIDFPNAILTLDQDISSSLPTGFEISASEEAPILAARLATLTPAHQDLPPLDMRLGSTKGTNALLERKGAPVTFITTKGFKDLLFIGTQQRPHLFQLNIPEPVLLYHELVEIDERIDASGNVLHPLKTEELDALVRQLLEKNTAVAAIALVNAYRNPVHEQKIAEALRLAGIPFISRSHVLTPSIKILPRAQTALVNAYLSPVLYDYLQHIEASIGKTKALGTLQVMTSAGGLVSSEFFYPKDSLLSGPAGGVVGASRIAAGLGFSKVLTFDMGGTSTDTARYDQGLDYEYISRVGGVEMLSPALFIETVAAGGGSVCWFDGNQLRVGPESAGASPGPACYGAGGPLTITDVNLLLGKLEPSAMGIPVQREKARAALEKLQEEILFKTGAPYTPIELLQGLEKIADEKMADAIRRISVSKGFDPREYALLAFGGAGGLHVCRIAELLSIDTLILPYDGGLLSAFGIGHARLERLAEQQVLQPLKEVSRQLPLLVDSLSREALARLEKEGITPQDMEIRNVLVYLRFKGQDSSLEIPFESMETLGTDFKSRYRKLFGHYPEAQPIEVESIKVFAASKAVHHAAPPLPAEKTTPAPGMYQSTMRTQSPVPVFFWEELEEGSVFQGPAILLNPNSTAFIEKGWELEIRSGKNAVVQRMHTEELKEEILKEAIELELFTNRFSAIALEMGAQLQRTAFSVNIKERLDFSCALLDPSCELLVNAPHIPVHLGSLGICARLVREKTPLGKGDVVITNHPKYGGSHLPDVTLLSAVFSDDDRLIGYVINRAHHAEMGGKRPGSMPPDATTLLEEGVVIPPTYLVKNGVVQWPVLEAMLTKSRYPSRAPSENLADINAALASLRSGEEALKKLVQFHGLEKVHYYMAGLKATAQEALQEALRVFNGRTFQAVEQLDDGHAIHVRINVGQGRIEIDFSGTSAVHPFNLNANISIVYSAVIYVLRLLCQKEIPLNEGLMQHVEIRLPECFLHPSFQDDPEVCPAVVGGNTEVSQRLVDTLLKAFGVAACSQGTMNNFLFGNERFGYYETIGGGAGAGPGFHGRSAVHQHMTNTRITDPEELELRYPVRLERFAIRYDSGGSGRWKGGDGIIREMTFLEPVDMTLLSQHRNVPPYGMHGGSDGNTGRQYVIRSNGHVEKLQGIGSRTMHTGDRIVIETPGGGGWGKEEKS